MNISVIIPTFNESGNIEAVLDGVKRQNPFEIIVVDGHSTDDTQEKVKKAGVKLLVQLGRGLGDAIKTGIAGAAGDIVIIVDADGSHDTADIPKLAAKIEEGYDLVVASRYISGPELRGLLGNKRSSSYDDTFIREFGNRMFTWLVRKLYGAEVHDLLMGYKAFRKSIFNKIILTETGQQFDAEIVIKSKKSGFKLAEVPTIEYKRKFGESKLSVPYHGMKVLWVIIKELFTK